MKTTRKSQEKKFYIREATTNKIQETTMTLKEFKDTHSLTQSQGNKRLGVLGDGRPWAREIINIPHLAVNKGCSVVGYYKPRTKFPRASVNRVDVDNKLHEIITTSIQGHLNTTGVSLEIYYDGSGFYSEGVAGGELDPLGPREEYQGLLDNYYDVLFPTTVWPAICVFLDTNYKDSVNQDVWLNLCNYAYTQSYKPFSFSNSPRFLSRMIALKAQEARRACVPTNSWNAEIDDIWLLEHIERTAKFFPLHSECIRDPQRVALEDHKEEVDGVRYRMVSSVLSGVPHDFVSAVKALTKPQRNVKHPGAYNKRLMDKALMLNYKQEIMLNYAMVCGLDLDKLNLNP